MWQFFVLQLKYIIIDVAKNLYIYFSIIEAIKLTFDALIFRNWFLISGFPCEIQFLVFFVFFLFFLFFFKDTE